MRATALAKFCLGHLPAPVERVGHRLLFPAHDALLREAKGAIAPEAIREAKALFIHTPRTAGSSITNALPPTVLRHSHLSIYDHRVLLGRARCDELFKFGFVRNPWDRLVSSFFHLKRGGNHAKDQEWAATHLSAYDDFEPFVTNWLNEKSIYSRVWHFLPLAHFVCLPGQKKHALDHLGRFETLADDFAAVSRKLGTELVLPHTNHAPRKHEDYRAFYTPKTREIVARVYAADIRAFDYSF